MRSASATASGSLLVALGEARPGAVLHDEVRAAVGGDVGVVDRDDGRVRRQLRHEVRLGDERGAARRRELVGEQHLHRDAAPRQLLLVQEDVGEPAGAEQLGRTS